MVSRNSVQVAGVVVGLFAWGATAHAQVSVSTHVTFGGRPFAANVIVPQSRAFLLSSHAAAPQPAVQITEVAVGVTILEQAATTAMDISLSNPGGTRIEGELVVPVPDGAVVRGFTFQGGGAEPTAQLLPREEARRIYESIVAKSRDPALLEFVGYNLIRSSVFPIEARGTQKLRLTYEHLLPADGNRVDYVLPRSESVGYSVPWKISVQIRSKAPVSTVYSPSHAIETARVGPGAISARLTEAATREPGPFRLSYLLEQGSVTASLLAYPDPKVGGGYFLLLAGLPAAPATSTAPSAIKREVTLVIDRSGSMNGEKIEQVREAALQVLAGLDDGEAFNLITYNESVSPYSPAPIVKSAATMQSAREFIKAIKAQGGTNIHDALVEALRPKPANGVLPIVLFLTDGLPTVGQTSEAVIRDVATKSNAYGRRIFTFGVGVDVNTPLLEKVASENRATATFVLPKEDVELKVAAVFKRLSGPVLADPALEVVTEGGAAAPGRVIDLLPVRLPDLFAGDQLVLLGRYTGGEPLNFQVTGNYLGNRRTFRFKFELDKATTRNAFVPRLWASRKIAVLVDAIRQSGAVSRPLPVANAVATAATDPKLKELVDEIIKLSTEFGILTEYTAFLANEGTDLSNRSDVLSQANSNFDNRAVAVRSGWGSFNQESNSIFMKNQFFLNGRNNYVDEKMNRVAVTTVQQVNDRAFYRKNNRWVDSQVVERENSVKPAKVIEFGSEEFRQLVRRLADEGRQGTVALGGDVLMVVDGQPVLVKTPQAAN